MKEFTPDKRIKLIRDSRLLLAAGAVIGALIFIAIYGIKILNFTYDAWLFGGDIDLKQHYVGWCHYRTSDWGFPIGMIDSLSAPHDMSVIYTDSIPLFAVIFKIFEAYLPVHFQYFGLFGILSFALTGAISAMLMHRFIDNIYLCMLTVPFFVASFPIIQRMYYHSALGAHWIILLAFLFYVYDSERTLPETRIIEWSVLGFLCVSIHSYYLPMVGMVLLADVVTRAISFPRNEFSRDKVIRRGSLLESCLPLVGFCLAAILNLALLGGFAGNTSPFGEGLGTFGSNMNTFLNPLTYGRILPKQPLYYDFQYEGYAYLGAGILALSLVADVGIVLGFISRRKNSELLEWDLDANDCPGGELKPFLLIITVLGLISFLSATLPLLAWGSAKVVNLPYPKWVIKFLGIFRSNGRFIWVAMYILIMAVLILVYRFFRRNTFIAAAVIAAGLVIQAIDISGAAAQKHAYFANEQEFVNIWDAKELTDIPADKDKVVFLYGDNDILIETGMYTYLTGKSQNNYYYARDIAQDIGASMSEALSELNSGEASEDTIYVLKEEDYKASADFYDELGLKMALVGGHVFMWK